MKRSPTDVFALLALLFGIGGLLAAMQSHSVFPIVGVAVVLWVLLKFTNFLERRK